MVKVCYISVEGTLSFVDCSSLDKVNELIGCENVYYAPLFSDHASFKMVFLICDSINEIRVEEENKILPPKNVWFEEHIPFPVLGNVIICLSEETEEGSETLLDIPLVEEDLRILISEYLPKENAKYCSKKSSVFWEGTFCCLHSIEYNTPFKPLRSLKSLRRMEEIVNKLEFQDYTLLDWIEVHPDNVH